MALKLQAEHLKNKPAEARKTYTMFAWFIVVTLVIVLGFMGFCLYIGKEEFVIKFLQYAMYPAVSAVFYWVGKKTGRSDMKKDKEDESGAEVL